VRSFAKTLLVGLGMISAVAGCVDNPPPVERVPVAAPADADARRGYDRPKPLPEQSRLYDRDLPAEPGRPAPAPQK
jgi:hypothetical protein